MCSSPPLLMSGLSYPLISFASYYVSFCPSPFCSPIITSPRLSSSLLLPSSILLFLSSLFYPVLFLSPPPHLSTPYFHTLLFSLLSSSYTLHSYPVVQNRRNNNMLKLFYYSSVSPNQSNHDSAPQVPLMCFSVLYVCSSV